MFQLIPVFHFIRRKCYPALHTPPELCEDEILILFADKILALSKHDTIRISYEMGDLLRSCSVEEVEYFANHSIQYLARTLQFVRRVRC